MVQNRDAIEADQTVKIYEPFDELNANTLRNTSVWQYISTEIGGFNQSALAVNVPYGENEFVDAYIPFSYVSLEGNATVSFKMLTSYTVKKLPGLEINLVDDNKNALADDTITGFTGILLSKQATKAPDTTDNKPDGGCGGVSLGAIIALAVGMFGVGFTVIDNK